jgi:hypothetical protein
VEARHAELLARRERRRQELKHQRSLTLQGVERLASVLVLPHPEREAPEVRRLQPNAETEAMAMRVVMEYERIQGREVYDVHDKNLGYDIISLDLSSGELRLIEVKGIGGATGTILSRLMNGASPKTAGIAPGSTLSRTAIRHRRCKSRSTIRPAFTGTK